MPSIDNRSTEQGSYDPVGADKVRDIARRLMAAVGDPTVHPSVHVRVARAIVNRQVSPEEVGRLCDTIIAKSTSGELDSPGAYYIASVKRLFQRHEVAWRSARRQPKTDLLGD